MFIENAMVFSNKQDLGTTPGAAVSTNVVDVRNSTPAAITNRNVTSGNPMAPATPADPMQLLEGIKPDIHIMSCSNFAGTGTVTIKVDLQGSVDNSTFETIETLGLISSANFQAGKEYRFTANGQDRNASGSKYNYFRLNYTTAGTTITVSPVVSASLQPQ